MELYQNDDMFAELCSKMYEYYRQRSSKLKERDAKREQEAGWYHRKDMLGMMLYIDNFAGNMQGVKEKIPYLKECNINCLHFIAASLGYLQVEGMANACAIFVNPPL